MASSRPRKYFFTRFLTTRLDRITDRPTDWTRVSRDPLKKILSMLISDPTLRPYYLRAKDRYIILHFQSGLITSIRDEKGEKKEKWICILYLTKTWNKWFLVDLKNSCLQMGLLTGGWINWQINGEIAGYTLFVLSSRCSMVRKEFIRILQSRISSREVFVGFDLLLIFHWPAKVSLEIHLSLKPVHLSFMLALGASGSA